MADIFGTNSVFKRSIRDEWASGWKSEIVTKSGSSYISVVCSKADIRNPGLQGDRGFSFSFMKVLFIANVYESRVQIFQTCKLYVRKYNPTENVPEKLSIKSEIIIQVNPGPGPTFSITLWKSGPESFILCFMKLGMSHRKLAFLRHSSRQFPLKGP